MKQSLIAGIVLMVCSAAFAQPVDYLRDVKPIFSRHCYKCHGPEHRNASLRLDYVPYILEGGDSGPAITPGNIDDSFLLKAVTGTTPIEGFRMPPEDQDDRLSEAEVATLRRWIEQGAKAPPEAEPPGDPLHWAFVKPVRHDVPRVASADPAWAANPIDAFLAAQHAEHGLKPAPPASKEHLLRRVYIDLIGLPPTPQQLQAFLDDTSEGAYERVVDELLASPLHGQRWGRHWMDIWRYSDWYGYRAEIRNSQRHIWRWRDWIIDSLNADRPYDQMVMHMLAGDEVAPTDPQALAATGFLARHWYRYNRDMWLDSVVEHTGKAFLGVTFNCARCHEHKYDPISQRDYYRMRAFFEPYDVRLDRLPGEPDVNKDALTRTYDAHHDRLTYRYIRGNDKQPDKTRPIEPGIAKALGGPAIGIEPVELPPLAYRPGLHEHVRKQLLEAGAKEQEKAKAHLDAAALTAARQRVRHMIAGEKIEPSHELSLALRALAVADAQIAAMHAAIAADDVLYLGKSGDEDALTLAATKAGRHAKLLAAELELSRAEDAWAKAENAKPAPKKKAKDRLDDARKAAETARGDVKKTDIDYSLIKEPYPATSTGRRSALARWIVSEDNPLTARVAVNHIWTRHFDQPLVHSVFEFGSAGQQPTHPKLLDYLAVWFMDNGWSMRKLHRLIVTSAAYRMDSSGGSAAADNLAIDPDNRYLWRQNVGRMEAEIIRDALLAMDGRLDLTAGGAEEDHTKLLSTFRRSIYYRSAPEKQATFMMTFDAASPLECYRRNESIVPQQALAMANSTLTIEAARLIATRIGESVAAEPGHRRDPAFIERSFTTVLSRKPTTQEMGMCLQFLDDQQATLSTPEDLIAFDNAAAAAKVKPAADPRQRARENLLHVLLNHNDFVTIR